MATATKDSSIQIKVDPELKADAAGIAEELGMNLSTLINGYLKRGVAERGIPFPLAAPLTPNARTRQAIRDLRAGKTKRFDTAEEALRDMGI